MFTPEQIVSIHAPARGATQSWHQWRRDCVVSIHAPARGATTRRRSCCLCYRVSIHAPARGATKETDRHVEAMVFQSTPPRGGRQDALALGDVHDRFNPRPRAGGDSSWRCLAAWFRFQSTPPRGGRRPPPPNSPASSVFQSTPPRGGRH